MPSSDGVASISNAFIRYLHSLPSDANIGTLQQTAAFVKNQDPENYQEEAKKRKPEVYTPENFRRQDGSVALVKQLNKDLTDYAWQSELVKIHQSITHLGDGIVYDALKTNPITSSGLDFIAHITGESHQLKKLKDLEKKVTAPSYEFARRLALSPEDHERLRQMPPEQAVAELHALATAPFWSNFTGDRPIPDAIKHEFLKLQAHIIQTKEDYAKHLNVPPTQSDEEFVHDIYQVVQISQNIAQLPETWNQDFEILKGYATEARQELTTLSNRITELERGSQEQLKMSRFFLDIQYKNLTTEEKIDGIKRHLYPDKIGELDSLELLRKWEKNEKAFMEYTGYAFKGAQLARQIGIKLPRDLEKGIVGSQHAFHVFMGVSTGNPLQVINGLGGIVGLFKGAGPDINAVRHQEIMEALSLVLEGQQQIMEVLENIQQQLIQIYELNVHIATAVNQIGTMIIQQHAEIMAELHQIGRDILYNRELLIQIHLSHLVNIRSLTQAREHHDYQCSNGIFATHACAQRFFNEHHLEFNEIMNKNFTLFRTDGIDAGLKFEGAYLSQSDVSQSPGSNRYFENKIWGTAYHYYNTQLTEEQRITIFRALFEPAIYIGSIDSFSQASWTLGDRLKSFGHERMNIETFCRTWFNQLITSKIILEAGEFTVDFHRYYPMIKHFPTGQLYTVEELLETNRRMHEPQEKGLRILERIFAFINLSIAQHHLLSGGPLIPIFYAKFFEELANYTQAMRGPTTTEAERQTLQREASSAVDLLAYNPIFARNMLLYALRKKLNIQESDSEKNVKCLRYRMAYNYKTDATALQNLFPGWEFTPLQSSQYSNGHGWNLRLPFKASGNLDKEDEVLIELIHPSDLFFGRVDYTLDLQQLLRLRASLVQEIVGYKFVAQLADKADLQEALADNIILRT